MVGARETSCFRGPKSTFRDRCKGSELPRCADFVAGTALCEPRCADFVAGAALCEPRRADFVAGAALGEPRSADFVTGTILCVNPQMQISW